MSGLPSDWEYVLPSDESFADVQVSAPLGAATRSAKRSHVETLSVDADDREVGSMTVAGIPVAALLGEVALGSLNPVGETVSLGPDIGDTVGPANRQLSVDVMNRDYNPYIAQPEGEVGEPLVGAFVEPGEVYEGKCFIPIKALLQALVGHMGDAGAAVMPLVEALNEVGVLRTPAHQFNVPDGPGNDVVFYGGDVTKHRDIDRVVGELGARHMRVIKQMVHFNDVAQGGTTEDIVRDGVGGSTHSGGFSIGYHAGKPVSVKSDWPSSYATLDQGNSTYNANLFAIDYQAGTLDVIPDEVLAEYKRNADMWDCCAGIVVPFTSEELDPEHQDYMFNPLEVFDQQSARAVAKALAQLDRKNFLIEHGAFYCSEGQYSVANLGPQEDADGGTLLKKSRYGETPLGRLITTFQTAPDYQDMAPEERVRHPEIGWNYLKTLGGENGGIDESQFKALEESDRTAIYLDWIAEDCPGWQSFRPLNGDGLIARPMTVVTMAWGILRRYLPREAIARAVAADVMRAFQAGDDEVRQATTILCGGHPLSSEEGQGALASVAMRAATGMLLGLLNSDNFRDKLLKKAGYEQIANDNDKQKVLDEYAAFVGILRNADHSSQRALDEAVMQADERFGSLIVERRHFNAVDNVYVTKRKSLMKYAAPSSIGMWAQQPFLAETGCLRYVATAMHTNQASPDAPVG